MQPIAIVATVAAALLGAGGVAAAAGSSHAGAALLGPLSLIALTHAPALLAIALAAPRTRAFSLALLLLGTGAVVFCLDLAMRHYLGRGLIPLIAPLSGVLMILGWLTTGVAAVLARRI